jgi:5-methylcytosine-specific restriction endonuclease McrA
MKNLLSYNGDAFSEYKNAVERKKGNTDVLEGIETDIKSAYDKYKSNFDLNTLYQIAIDKKFDDHKSELLSLYDYQNKIIRDIRENIKNQQIETIRTTCQNCTIDSVCTMDHILPKTFYPEYAVNAYNLFPCCSICNEYKSKITGEQKFLNLFLDKLPDIQYLFVEIRREKDGLNFRFYLSNNQMKMGHLLFQTIENHFENLHLLQRMKDCSISYLSDFISSIQPHYSRNGKNYVIETVLESIDDERKGYGFNYWKSSLKIALIDSSDFWDYITPKCV